MAEGETNAASRGQLWLAENTVETHVSSILRKLDLPPDGDTQDASSPSSPLRRAAPA